MITRFIFVLLHPMDNIYVCACMYRSRSIEQDNSVKDDSSPIVARLRWKYHKILLSNLFVIVQVIGHLLKIHELNLCLIFYEKDFADNFFGLEHNSSFFSRSSCFSRLRQSGNKHFDKNIFLRRSHDVHTNDVYYAA